MPQYTILESFPDHIGYHCGYCGKDTACSKGLWAHSMNAIDYQDLIDRGWRRSGKYCYKCFMKMACCPLYTIRCEALNYELTKSKKKVLNKMKQFLMKEGDEDVARWKEKQSSQTEKPPSHQKKLVKSIENPSMVTSGSAQIQGTSNVDNKVAKLKKEVRKGDGPDPSKQLCKKAKVLRQERRLLKIQESGDAAAVKLKKTQEPCILESCVPHLSEIPNLKKRLVVRTVRADVRDEQFCKYKNESYEVYKKYQMTIHGDSASECSEKQWIRFLVDCPINRDASGPGPGYGNYHQQYVLDDKIIAVGVIDILPNCVSSVYLYYDPDFGFLSLGVYTALSEIAFVRKLHQESSQLQYYYMGFYIHDCPKMNYKREFPPSYLLCPETYEWVLLTLCLDTLGKSKYARLNVLKGGSPDAVDPLRGEDSDVNEIGILYQRSITNFSLYSQLHYHNVQLLQASASTRQHSDDVAKQRDAMEKEATEMKEYLSAVGKKCARRMLLFRASDEFD